MRVYRIYNVYVRVQNSSTGFITGLSMLDANALKLGRKLLVLFDPFCLCCESDNNISQRIVHLNKSVS